MPVADLRVVKINRNVLFDGFGMLIARAVAAEDRATAGRAVGRMLGAVIHDDVKALKG